MQEAARSTLTAELSAGDAVFIPEGWWHQVDSSDHTIAVNFWWQSAMARILGAGAPLDPAQGPLSPTS